MSRTRYTELQVTSHFSFLRGAASLGAAEEEAAGRLQLRGREVGRRRVVPQEDQPLRHREGIPCRL